MPKNKRGSDECNEEHYSKCFNGRSGIKEQRKIIFFIFYKLSGLINTESDLTSMAMNN
jgi:hypothetical protein